MLPYKILMIITLLAAVTTLFTGVFNLARGTHKSDRTFSNKLMMLRVGLCLLLFVEMLVYAFFLQA